MSPFIRTPSTAPKSVPRQSVAFAPRARTAGQAGRYLGLGALLTGLTLIMASGPAPAQAQDAAAEILAIKARQQGFKCEKPVTAEKDKKQTTARESAWTITCKNARYHMQLRPDMAAHIKVLKH